MPPTDNLYKFIFISGILIYLYSLTFVVQQFKEKRNLEFKYYSELNDVRCEIVDDSINMERLKYEFYQIKKLDLSEYDILVTDTLKLQKEAQKIFFKYQSIVSKSLINKDKRRNIQNRLTEPETYFEGARQVFFVLFFSGIVLIPFGFFLWYNKLHRPNMAILERKLDLEKINVKKNIKTKLSIALAIILFFIASLLPLFIFEKALRKGKEVKSELIQNGVLPIDKN